MKALLTAINNRISKALNELHINLLSDLDGDNLDLLDSLLTKTINNKLVYTYFPKTKEELIEIIKVEVKKNGWVCSLNHINVSKITDMSHLFRDCKPKGYELGEFNGDISKWDVRNVKKMHCMFEHSKFNGDISKWDVSSVKDMSWMFAWSEFTGENGDLNNWDVSNVNTMQSMFDGSEFNGDISNWDVSNVENMMHMFYRAKFNRDISKWVFKNVKYCTEMFDHCPIKKEYKP